jgi:hypothetical protein
MVVWEYFLGGPDPTGERRESGGMRERDREINRVGRRVRERE